MTTAIVDDPYVVDEKQHDTVVVDGWEDDEDEWSFEEDDDFGESNNSVGSHTHHPADPPAAAPLFVAPEPHDDRTARLYGTLCEYMDYLHAPTLTGSVNACFDRRVNTGAAAAELIQYYDSRPRLRSYTLETELPRMRYTVVTEEGDTLTRTEDIRARYHDPSSQDDDDTELLWRAANQSLLADAISTLTYGLRPPLLRPPLLITALAQRCHFTLDLSSHNNDKRLTCTCDLVLRFPGVELARVSLHLTFAPHSNDVFACRVVALTPTGTDVITHATLRRMAAELARDTVDDDDDYDPPPQQFSFRDSLVVQQHVQGIKSALDQVDTVVNLQSKWRLLRHVLPALPSAELLREAERESAGVSVKVTMDDDDPVREEEGEGLRLYRREDQADHVRPLRGNDRRQELQDGHAVGSTPHTIGNGDKMRLYNCEDEEEYTPTVQLYQEEKEVPPHHTNNGDVTIEEDGLQLYRTEEPQQPNGTVHIQEDPGTQQQDHVVLPSYYEVPPQTEEEEDISGGWSDDDEDLDLELQSSPSWTKPEEDLCPEEDYAIKMDSNIVETRKRWLRPMVSLGRIRF